MLDENLPQMLIRLAMYEKIALVGSVCFALLLLLLGIYTAYKTSDAHWLNRFGAAIVAVEGTIAILEYIRQARLETVHRILSKKHKTNESNKLNDDINYFHKEVRKSEFQILFIATLLAVIGELLHGFGDILFVLIIGSSKH